MIRLLPTLTTLLFLSASVVADTELLEHFSTTLNGGLLVPQSDLKDYIKQGPSTGLTLTSSYYQGVKARLFFEYSYLTTTQSATSQRNIHSIVVAAGLVWKPPVRGVPSLGVALGNHLIHANPIGSNQTSAELLMDSNESEVEIFPSLFYPLSLSPRVQIEVGAEWHTILSKPAFSHLLRPYLGVTYLCW